MTTETTPARTATGGRDRYFDVLRTACILWVVVYHIFSDQAWLGFWPAMGLLFAISGSLMVRSLDRNTVQTLRSRLQRLLPVLWLMGLIAVPLMFWHGWPADERPPLWRLIFWIFPVSDPPGSAWAESATEPLWYMRSIVWFILLSPVLLILFRWYPKTMIMLPLAVMVGVGTGTIGFGWGGELAEGVLLDGSTFLACWLLGFAHREGMLKKIPVWAVVAVGLALAAVSTWWALTHLEENSYDFNLIPMGQALYSFGIVLILLRFAPKFSWVGDHKILSRTITIINGRAMVIYLWHNVAIELSYPLGDKVNVWRFGETGGTALCAVIAILLTIAGMLAFGWIEDVAAQRRPQLIPSDLSKKGSAPAKPEPAAAAAGAVRPEALRPGVADSTVVLAQVPGPEQGGYYGQAGRYEDPRVAGGQPRQGGRPPADVNGGDNLRWNAYRSGSAAREKPVPSFDDTGTIPRDTGR